jgi:hypothetical protein
MFMAPPLTPGQRRAWSAMFVTAAAFNFAIGFPLMLARDWAFALAFAPAITAVPGYAPNLWADFGFAVALIGLGYLWVAFDVSRNRAMVWLGILAKAFDVVVLTWRTIAGDMRPFVLLPAAIDAVFIALFILFLVRTAGRRTD